MFHHYITHIFLVFLLIVVASATAVATPKLLPADAMLSVGDTIYCDAYSMVPLEKVKKLLADGAIVSASWQFKITRQREYWLDQTMANTEVIYQVTPDLIAGRWILLNVASGVVKTTRSLQHALRFLLQARHVRLMSRKDQAQWEANSEGATAYDVHVRLHISDGVIAPKGWRAWLRLGKTVAIRRFSLP